MHRQNWIDLKLYVWEILQLRAHTRYWNVPRVGYRLMHDELIKWKIFRVTGHFCGEFTGPRWIPCTKANDAELWCFLWSVPEYTLELTMMMLVIWDAIAPIMMAECDPCHAWVHSVVAGTRDWTHHRHRDSCLPHHYLFARAAAPERVPHGPRSKSWK